jgi:peptidoglycan/xylan/chitin deacetylase (PgdA/CDA1 family)
MSFSWPEGKRGAVSLSFDDARPSQIERGLPILDAYGVPATFYVSPGPMAARAAAWRSAAGLGHEIGNHTARHPCSGNFAFARGRPLEEYTLDQMEAELSDATEAIREAVGVAPATFAYPCGQKFVGRGTGVRSYVPLVAERFVAGRGFRDEDANDPLFCDLAQVLAVDADDLSYDELSRWLRKAAAEGRWLVLAGHEIGDGGRQTVRASALEQLCRDAGGEGSDLWIATVAAVASFIARPRGG